MGGIRSLSPPHSFFRLLHFRLRDGSSSRLCAACSGTSASDKLAADGGRTAKKLTVQILADTVAENAGFSRPLAFFIVSTSRSDPTVEDIFCRFIEQTNSVPLFRIVNHPG